MEKTKRGQGRKKEMKKRTKGGREKNGAMRNKGRYAEDGRGIEKISAYKKKCEEKVDDERRKLH